MSIEVGTKLQGKVTGITNFGAFVELSEGVTGLVHISEIADNFVKSVSDHLKVNDIITVKVIDVKEGKIGLSIRKAVDKPSQPQRGAQRGSNQRGSRSARPKKINLSFEDHMVKFLKDSEERMSSLNQKNNDRRGKKGAKRS